MPLSNPRSTAKIFGHPVHPMIVPFPITFFVSAFAVDLLYLCYGGQVWATASIWLLGAGLVTAAVAAVLGLTDFAGDARIRGLRDAWLHMFANVTAVLVEAVNLFLRIGEGSGIIGSAGVYLSGFAVLLLMFSGWKGGELVYRHRVGVMESDPNSV